MEILKIKKLAQGRRYDKIFKFLDLEDGRRAICYISNNPQGTWDVKGFYALVKEDEKGLEVLDIQKDIECLTNKWNVSYSEKITKPAKSEEEDYSNVVTRWCSHSDEDWEEGDFDEDAYLCIQREIKKASGKLA